MFRRFVFFRIWSSAQDHAVLALLLNLLVFSFRSDRICHIEMFCIGGVPVKNSFSAGPDLNYFYMIHRGGRLENALGKHDSSKLDSKVLISKCVIVGSRISTLDSSRIRWPINRSNRFSDFLRLDRLDRFGKIIKSIFSKFWKREFKFFSDFQNFFGFLKFREIFFPCILSKLPVSVTSVVVAYSLTLSDVKRKVSDSKPTYTEGPEYQLIIFLKVLLRFTRTCTTYITFFDVNFEHSNFQRPFCELLSHTMSLYLMIFVTGSYKKWRSGILWPQ